MAFISFPLSPSSAVDPLDTLPVPVLEQHVGLARHACAVPGEGDDPHNALQDLVRQERVSLHPMQYLHAGGEGSERGRTQKIEQKQEQREEGREKKANTSGKEIITYNVTVLVELSQ